MAKAILVFSLLMSASALAHPTSYQGATSVMTWNQPFLNDTMVTYTFANRAAIAARYMRMVMRDGEEMYTYMPQLNLLVSRWNEDDHQANIYLFGGGGVQELRNEKQFMGLAGIETDAESRWWYVSAKYQALIPKAGDTIHQTQFRTGVAAYASAYEELASWFILSVQYEPQLLREVTITPMARMFYKNVLWEVGSSLKGDWMLNIMFHF
jgi:hypothetical protein